MTGKQENFEPLRFGEKIAEEFVEAASGETATKTRKKRTAKTTWDWHLLYVAVTNHTPSHKLSESYYRNGIIYVKRIDGRCFKLNESKGFQATPISKKRFQKVVVGLEPINK